MSPAQRNEYRSVTCIATGELGNNKVWLVEEADLSRWWIIITTEEKVGVLLDARYKQAFKPKDFGMVLSEYEGSLTEEEKSSMLRSGKISGLFHGWQLTPKGKDFVGRGI